MEGSMAQGYKLSFKILMYAFGKENLAMDKKQDIFLQKANNLSIMDN